MNTENSLLDNIPESVNDKPMIPSEANRGEFVFDIEKIQRINEGINYLYDLGIIKP